MRPIVWLQVSDFHLRAGNAWQQDVALSAMCKDIENRRVDLGGFDFVLATGDIAFAGRQSEYKLAAAFFDELSRASGVPVERIYCVPGNHDVERDRKRLAFAGARYTLTNQAEVDLLLGDSDELSDLLRRQKSYRNFVDKYFSGQGKIWFDNGLGYVANLILDDIEVGIFAFNSSWLAEGGDADHGKLIIGERQVIDALALMSSMAPHVVLGMAHHPLHLLNEFDRRPVRRRIEDVCHFFHCGHLHTPETNEAGRGTTRCLTVTAGAAFETRHTRNSYAVITADLLHARRTLKTFRYEADAGAFATEATEDFDLQISGGEQCGIAPLAAALVGSQPATAAFPHYLAGLLLDAQSELPILVGDRVAFASMDLLIESECSESLKEQAAAFLAVRNPLRLFYGRNSLREILERHGAAVDTYAQTLKDLCARHPTLSQRLAEREQDAEVFAAAEPSGPFSNTLELMKELSAAEDWQQLIETASRHLDSPAEVAAVAQRYLALAYSHFDDSASRSGAADLYARLSASPFGVPDDHAALAVLLCAAEDYEGAKTALFEGLKRFPQWPDVFLAVGGQIVTATGDRELRDRLSGRGVMGGGQ